MCSNSPDPRDQNPIDPSDITGTLTRETTRVEQRRNALLAQINTRLFAAYTAPDRSVSQQAAYIDSLTLITHLTTLIHDFCTTLSPDMIPLMEALGYNFSLSTILLGWDRQRWTDYFQGLREGFEADEEYCRECGEMVKEELERSERGEARRFAVQRDWEGRAVAVYDEDVLEAWRSDSVERSGEVVAEFWRMVEGLGGEDDEDDGGDVVERDE